MKKMRSLILLIPLLFSCKTYQNTQLKDDILAKDASGVQYLYWHVTFLNSDDPGFICRAPCPDIKFNTRGNLTETRESCDRANTQSIPAKIWQDDEKLSKYLSILNESITPRNVLVLKDPNEAALFAQHFQDQNLYTSPEFAEARRQDEAYAKKMKELAEHGLEPTEGEKLPSHVEQLPVEKTYRYAPQCYAEQAVVTVLAAGPDGKPDDDVTVAEDPDIDDTLPLPKSFYLGLYNSLAARCGQVKKEGPTNLQATYDEKGQLIIYDRKGDQGYEVYFISDQSGLESAVLKSYSQETGENPVSVELNFSDHHKNLRWLELIKALSIGSQFSVRKSRLLKDNQDSLEAIKVMCQTKNEQKDVFRVWFTFNRGSFIAPRLHCLELGTIDLSDNLSVRFAAKLDAQEMDCQQFYNKN